MYVDVENSWRWDVRTLVCYVVGSCCMCVAFLCTIAQSQWVNGMCVTIGMKVQFMVKGNFLQCPRTQAHKLMLKSSGQPKRNGFLWLSTLGFNSGFLRSEVNLNQMNLHSYRNARVKPQFQKF
uniref:Uncharacterized protein n=1 Tax=Glossina austeni TaxID=7395 RepID=A0A1A9UWZ0_GLOAU